MFPEKEKFNDEQIPEITRPEEQIEKKIKYEPITSLRAPIEHILKKLSENIDRGGYQLIIGDDASGRIPALILDRVLRSLYRERKYSEPQTYFFAGSKCLESGKREEKTSRITDYLRKAIEKAERRGEKLDTKALVVTDTIATGESLEPITEALKRNGIEFDIATIGLAFDAPFDKTVERKKELLEKKLGGRLVFGELGTPPIYGEGRLLSGVEKSREDIFARPYKADRWKPLKTEEIQEIIGEAREDVKILAEDLVEWYKSR